ncbi:NADPH-dependent quinone reductase ArsH [Galdieria sulphuraria]|nr:NADPH-dependent quinone reductase ArsH [Galdieria sulphuraria]
MDCPLTAEKDLSEWKKFRLDSDKNDWIEDIDISGAKSLYEKEAQDRPLRVLVLYGSLRQRSFSRCCAYEAARLLDYLGQVEETHHKVQELRELALWSEAQFWCSPEMHGNVTGCFKNQIDWIPLSLGSVRPTQGRTLAICQVNGGSQSFNAVNTLRVLGRWMQFDEYNRMKPSPLRDRLVDVVEELVKFSLMLRDHSSFLVDRYSERKEKGDFGRLLSQEEKKKNYVRTMF